MSAPEHVPESEPQASRPGGEPHGGPPFVSVVIPLKNERDTVVTLTHRIREQLVGYPHEILFIDARNLGYLINRRTRELSQEDIKKIASTYHNWRNPDGNYEDIAGFCAAVPISKVAELDFVLTPGRYVGLPDDEDDFDFKERFTNLKAELEAQLKEEAQLNEIISANLLKIKINE